MAKNIKSVKQTSSGLNTKFKLPSGKTINRGDLVKEINAGKHPDYHVRKIGKNNVPCSNPDGSKNNNLK